MTFWVAVLAAGVVSFALKFAGYVVPPQRLEEPRVRRVTAVLPAALLASLVVLQTFSTGRELVLDARAAGLVVAVLALVCRAPFIVVVVLAAGSAAGLRALGWG